MLAPKVGFLEWSGLSRVVETILWSRSRMEIQHDLQTYILGIANDLGDRMICWVEEEKEKEEEGEREKEGQQTGSDSDDRNSREKIDSLGIRYGAEVYPEISSKYQ
jgi:type II secretory pathway component PulJ